MHGLPLNTSVAEVVLRLARPEERLTWDRLMAERHELGFLRLEGRGQRSVAVLRTHWVPLAGAGRQARRCAFRGTG